MLALKEVRVGLRVRVAKVIDECGNQASIGAAGRIIRAERGTAGVGDSERDPFIHVRFDKPLRKQVTGGSWFDKQEKRCTLRTDGYWRQELVRLNPKRRRLP